VSHRFGSRDLAARFAHTLAPIAFAYVLAHYFSLLIYQGQAIGYLVSDPLGKGSNLFGTAHFQINSHLLSNSAIWYVQVIALVGGHVAGLILAHDRALAVYPRAQEAVRSQYWMLTVMVGFTCLGLWLLSAVATCGALPSCSRCWRRSPCRRGRWLTQRSRAPRLSRARP
jgi:hypothetical protein